MKVTKTGIKLFIFLFLLFQNQIVQAQIQKGALTPGKSVSSEIKTGEQHHFSVNLPNDRFALFKLMQNDIDLIITTFDADGKKIADFDSPNGRNGAEFINIFSGSKGIYKLEVRPLETQPHQGKYTLQIVKIEARAATPEKEVDQLFAAWEGKETPGAAIAVVKDGKIIYKKGYGLANLEYDVPIGPSTVFHIASVSKQFATFSILLLAKEGKLSLDDDIRKFIPEVPDFGKKITLRHLANHTSGLRDQWNLLAMAGWRLDDVITREHILKLVSRQKELNFNPGDEYLYCNTGYTLLAEVVSRVSGKSFAEFTAERIFKPLKMSSTLFYDDHEKIVRNRAYSYFGEGSGYKKSVLSYANVGATSLFTTVEDLSLWALNFENPSVGDREIMDEMEKPGILNNGRTLTYALGQSVGTYKGLKLISHSGGDAGYRTYLGRFPDQKFSVVVFSNDAFFNPGGMAQKVFDIYLKDQIAAVEKAKPKEETAQKPAEKKNNSVAVDIATLDSYVGQFELQPNFIITITQENGNLFGQATGQPKIELQPLSITKFLVKEINAEITFHKEENGSAVNLLKLNQGGVIRDAPRKKPFDEKSVVLSDFTGRFYSEELATEYVLSVENGKLVAKHPRLSDVSLTPAKTDSFTGNMWFFRNIEFVRNEKNAITGIRVSSGRVRNLWFEKIK